MTHDQPSLRTGSCFLVVVTILLAVRRSPEIFSHFRSSTSWRQKWWKTKQNENVSTVVKIWKCHVGIEPALFIDRFVVPSSTEQLYRAVVAFVAFRKTSTWQNDSRPACGLDHSWLTPCTEKLRFMLVEATGVYAHDIWRRDARDYTRLRQSKLDVVWLGPKVARNEVKNASFAQRSAHRDSRIWRPELIEPAAERKRRARRRRRTSKSAFSDP